MRDRQSYQWKIALGFSALITASTQFICDKKIAVSGNRPEGRRGPAAPHTYACDGFVLSRTEGKGRLQRSHSRVTESKRLSVAGVWTCWQ